MKRRIVAAALVVSMIFGILPITASAAASVSKSKQSEYNTISEKKYEIAPGITEYEIYKNTAAMDSQQAAHAMVIDADSLKNGNSQVRVGYNDYNLDSIQSGTGWGMKRTREQARAMETRANVNVVGAVNGDFFNMSNGRPVGVFVLDGRAIQQTGSSVIFWVDKNGKARITDYATISSDWNNVREALAGNAWLVRDGAVVEANDNVTKNPRTAVGITDGGDVVLYMVNGRQAPFSDGMTMLELAREMADLGCDVAMNLDGGGSSTFATQRAGEPNDDTYAGLSLRCRPSDGYERTVSSTLMVVSKVQQDGNFKTASISPYEEVYTPGSTIKFTATGADAGGGPATVPTDAVWSVTEGGDLGSINESTGEFTAKADAVGMVTVALSYNGEEVGTSDIELRWPDKLGFTNTSVSLDFGETSDLSFYPTYQGREVIYKDGDFTWSVDPEYYKHFVNVEQYNHPVWPSGWKQIQITLTGKQGNVVSGEFRTDGGAKYITKYQETSIKIDTLSDGTIQATETITHQGATSYDASFEPEHENITDNQDGVVQGLEKVKTETFPIGKFSGNKFIADENASLRGSISVHLANKSDSEPAGSIDVVVGLEPVVIMDFEGHGDVSAKNYWTIKEQNTMPTDVTENRNFREQNRVWVRDVNNQGRWPSIEAGDPYECGIVSKEEDSNVRFGDYAMRLAWDYRETALSVVGAACFGFSTPLMVDDTQPTKIGLWINVPRDLANSESVVKAIVAAGAYETAASDNYYWKLNDKNELEKKVGPYLAGTTSYVQYYSYDSEGNVNGEMLKDWAGKGWTWIEADVSSLQFPLNIYEGYTVRIVSAQNKVKDMGYVLIDNVQLIYGTNTNDINNPVIESVTELSSQTVLDGATATFNQSDLSFEVQYNDSAATDKYASGIDLSTTKVFLDGTDITGNEKVAVNANNMLVPVSGLVNGSHILKVQVRDQYGNTTTQSYPFTVEVEHGPTSELSVVGTTSGKIGKDYVIQIGNETELTNVNEATVTLEIPAAYAKEDMYTVTGENGFIATATVDPQAYTLTVTATKSAVASISLGDVELENIATVAFHIPVTAQKGDTFTFSVPAATYKDASGNSVTFAQPQDRAELTADYSITVDRAIQNLSSKITVVDGNGNPVSGATVKIYNGGTDEAQIGTTGADGTTNYTFNTAGRQTIYATTENGGRSWNTPVVVNAPSTEPTAAYRIQNNAVGDGATSRTFTWLSLIGGNETAETKLRYAETQYGVESGTVVEGTNELICFTETNSGTAYRLNTVTLTGLTPNTTYWYQVQKGEDQWTEALSFTTASDQKDGTTSFFVFGDIQTNDTANLAKAVEAVSGKQTTANLPKYSFGIQTGDAIDQVNQFTYWQPFFTVMNAANFGSIDVLHTMGNHEYYGDNEGEIAGSIFALPKTAQGSWYSVEYGSVYAAVVNNGGDRLKALEEIVDNAAKSKCAWKILVLHEPIYGTTDDMDAETRLKYTNLIEKAGFSVVFSGDDHSYARTYPMQGGKMLDEASSDGVVYYISGDLSNKNNEYHEYDHFAEAMPHSDIPGGKAGYGNLFLSVTADENEMKISAYKVPSFELVETYTRTRSNCQKGNHTYDSNSKYDMNSGELLCSVCGKAPQTPDADAQGLYATTDGKFVVLAQGAVKKNSFTMVGTDMYHSCADGYAHKAIVHDPRTCTTGGYITYECPECKATEQATTYAMPTGHRWDDSHICTECHTKGKSIEDEGVIVNFGTVSNPRTSDTTPSYVLVSGGVRPSTFVSVDGGKTALTYSNDDTLINGRIRDIYISWLGNNEVGEATVKFEGRGDYYGTRELKYIILPGTVENLRATTIGSDTVKLKWKVLGAQYVEIYLCDKAGNILDKTPVAKVEGKNTCTLKGLSYDTEYCFKAAARAVVNGTTYNSAYWSNILSVTTLGDPALDSRNFITGGTVTNNGMKFTGENIDGTWYYFLPSSADLTKVSLDITVKNSTGENVIVSGPGGSQTLTGSSGTVDLTALTAGNDSSYSVSLQYGETRSKIPVVIMKSANIPAMFLTSKVQGQDRSYVDASKSNSTTADMKLVGADGKEIYNGELTQLKARGNSTFTYAENKSYQIKLGTPSDLLGTQEAVQTWVLLAGYSDATKIHDKLFKDLASELGMPYVASSNWVDLYYDGEYRGTYLLSEKNSVSSTGVAITDMESAYKALNENYGGDPVVQTGTNSYGQEYFYTYGLTESENITGGYLIEINNDGIDEASGFKTAKGRTINVKSPEYAGQEAMKYISEYYQEFEDAVYAVDENGNYTGYNAKTEKYYYDYVDLNSLVQVFLLQELALNPDGFRSSVYFYKDADGIMYAGPIWDHDLVFGTGWEKYISSDIVDYHYLEDALIKIPSFKQALEKYYKETFAPAAKALLSTDGMVNAYLDVIHESVNMNNMLWPLVKVSNPSHAEHLWPDGTTYDDVTNTMKAWIRARLNVMDGLYMETPNVPGTPSIPNTTGGGAGGGNVPQTSPDGPKTTTTTDANGTVTEKTEYTDGTVTEKITQTDGSSTERTTTPDGVVGQKNTDAEGKVTSAEVVIPKEAEKQDVVTAPVEVPAAKTAEEAPEISVRTESSESKKVEIPVTEFGPGTVAVVVHEDGTEEIVRDCVIGENGVVLNVEGDVTLKIVDNTETFEDVEDANHWASDAVEFVAARELFKGTAENKFTPNGSMTRGMMVTVLYRLAYEPETTAEGFTDVPSGKYYSDAVAWAAENGVVNGYADNTFAPDDNVSREQLVTILHRYAQKKGYATETSGTLANFADAKSVSSWAADAMSWAVELGLVNGTDATHISPAKSATRAEVATILMRFCEKVVK